MSARTAQQTDASYLNDLPQYAGLADVQRVGLPVDRAAGYLARLAAVKKMVVRTMAGHMTGTPEWELKCALGRWMWEDAEAYAALEHRLTELRSRPSDVDKVLDYHLGDLLTEVLHSPGSLELCVGFFDVLAPAYIDAIKTYLDRTNPLADQPSVRLLKRIVADEQERLPMGRQFVEVLAKAPGGGEERAGWKAHFETFLRAAGGILGDDVPPDGSPKPKPRATEEYRISREFARDPRFRTIVPKVPPEEMREATDPLKHIMWLRLQEMTAVELIASVLYEWDDLPTEAVVDLARHCWDEVRHSLFGSVAFEQEGIDPNALPSWVGYAFHTLNLPPPNRYSHLAIAVEFAAMVHPGGKRGDWELARDHGHPLMTTFQDFDWADEVTHVKYGRRWLVRHVFNGDRQAAQQMADETMEQRRKFYARFPEAGAGADNPRGAY